MDFFKSVFSEDPSDSSSESEDSSSKTPQNPNPQIPSITNAWTFGSTLLKTIATKSESVIENYKQEIEDFSSGLKKETAIVRQAASRAVKDLPARLESGAAVAQTSLESVGQAIDNIGSTVSVIITQGKDSIFNANDEDSESELTENNDNNSDSNSKPNAKPYSRVDALIRAVQCDMKTYCEEPEEAGEYEVWKRGFLLEERSEEIDGVVEENGVIGEIYDEVVPGTVDHVTFWSRYFFRIYRVRRAEEARVKLVKRAIEGEEEEELSWDVDDEDEDTGFKSKDESGEEVKENEEKVDNMVLHGDEGAEECDSEVKSDGITEGRSNGDEGAEQCDSEVKSDGITEGRSNESELHGEKVGTVLNDKVSSEGKNGNISDFSVISSQRSSHEEEDLGWDEIEDIGSGDDGKAAPRMSPIVASLQKPLSGAEEDEDLTWDIEDDDEPINS